MLDRNGFSWFDRAAFAVLFTVIVLGLAWLAWGPT